MAWPNDSLIIESGNKTDKQLRLHKKKGVVQFLQETTTHLYRESCYHKGDVFHRMKADVHSCRFLNNIESVLEEDRNTIPCFLNLQLHLPNKIHRTLGVMSEKAFIIPSCAQVTKQLKKTSLRRVSLDEAKSFFLESSRPGYCRPD
jgi:hypothetical protein